MDSIDDDLDPGPTTFRLRDETDLIALVATTLGFHPTSSIVLVCVDAAGHMFQARCDLAPDAAGVPDVVQSLLSAGLRNGGRTTFLLTYTDDEHRSRLHLRAVTRALVRAHREVVMRLRVDGGRFYPTAGHGSMTARVGVPYELGSHPLLARRVLRGGVLHPDRDALVRSLDPVVGPETDAVAAAWTALGRLEVTDASVLLSEAEWLDRRLREDDPETWPPETLARVLRAVHVGRVRDVALTAAEPGTGDRWVRVWQRALRLAPAEAQAAPAALLGFAAWVAGDGALAWCGVERAQAVDPGHSLAGVVAELLEEAVPPPQAGPLRSSA